ncbi:rod shape-determining protein [Acholeplasma granularum]|uniref:Ppx/GppA phosphatase family protein n=1 Tax=Acholeplasma granularum TaxID=264635 RepID=UPI000471520F|nr:rod shape-determining protein [Acholeplasma granularum]
MNYGIIDLGSNSIRLEVFKYDGKKLHNIYSHREVIGLASYLLPEGYLSDLGIDTVIRVLKEFINLSQSYNLEKMFIIATATIRDARNQNEIVTRIKRASNLNVEVLDEAKEGIYGFKGVDIEYQIKNGLILDIGGGSTEVSVVIEEELKDAVSLNLGSLNAYITYVKDILPSKVENERIKQAVFKAFEQHKIEHKKMELAYGIGGTIRAALVLLENYYQKKFDFITRANIKDLISKIDPTKKKTYLSIIRMIPDRIHTIMPGLVILESIMDYFMVEKLIVSKYGVREGYLLEQINK